MAAVAVDAVLVDVVAEVEDEVDVLLGHGPVRRVVAVVPLLAGGGRERQRSDRCARVRRRAGVRDLGHVLPVAELVEVVAVRAEPAQLHVHRVRELRERPGTPVAHDVMHAGVGRDLPVDRHLAARHTAARHEQVRHQPRPQHHTVRLRRARGDSEPEGIPTSRDRRSRRSRLERGDLGHRRQGSDRGGAGEEGSARNRCGVHAPSLCRTPGGLTTPRGGRSMNSRRVPLALIIIVMTGAVLAVYSMIRSGRVFSTLHGVLRIFVGIMPGWEMPRLAMPPDRRHTIPYGVAIMLGSLIAVAVFQK